MLLFITRLSVVNYDLLIGKSGGPEKGRDFVLKI